MAAELTALVDRLEKVTARLEVVGSSGGSTGSVDNTVLARFVEDFDVIINGPVANLKELGDKIGGDVPEVCALIVEAFKEEREFLKKVSLCKKPGDVTSLLKPLSDKISQIQEFKDNHRSSKQFNHLSCLAESIASLGWVTVAPTPKPYVKECADSAQFWGNRILKEFKDKDKKQVEFVKAWYAILTDIQSYIQENFLTGIVWNKSGIDASQLGGGSAMGAPAPPPPPPVVLQSSSGGGGDDGKGALFASLNKGSDITSGLKKVTKDMQTHKNPNLRANQPVKASGGNTVSASTPTKPPKIELVGKKWEVENHVGNKNIQITETNSKQSVYIFKCIDSVIVIKGKVNNIVMDNCKKSAVCFDNAISSVDVVNSQSIQVQVLEKVPTVSIDKTDGCQVYLSNDSLGDVDIVTAKSSEMNILFPDPASKDGEFKEVPLPEQFKTKFDGKKMVTFPADTC